MAPASDNNNQDLATKKAKLEPNTVIGVGGISKFFHAIFIPQNLTNNEDRSEGGRGRQ